MDPLAAIVAIANTVTAITNAVSKAMDGMTPQQKEKYWDGYLADMAVWRALLAPLVQRIIPKP